VPVGFPLRDWIDGHAAAPHNLARSGMGPGLSTVRAALAEPLPEADPLALRDELARTIGVVPERVFLHHGASEANGSVLFFLHHEAVRARRARPTVVTETPEYPPLGDLARWVGFRPAAGRATVRIVSDPHNPTGQRRGTEAWRGLVGSARATLVDETFREFRDVPSRATSDTRRVWATGTFTKAYGADAIRVGWAVVPSAAIGPYSEFHGLAYNDVAAHSVAAARALLRRRRRILEESRAIFERNLTLVRRRLPEVPRLDAPVLLDRAPAWPDGDRFARALLARGVLVSPGAFFGAPDAVRICLTQKSFAEDFEAYLAVRGPAPPAE